MDSNGVFCCLSCIGVCAELEIVVVVTFHNLFEVLRNNRTIGYHHFEYA
jgi:hypothetical protein